MKMVRHSFNPWPEARPCRCQDVNEASKQPGLRPRVKRHSRQDARSGITILEILIATAIFLAAMTVLGALVTTGTQARTGAERHTQAVFHAQSKMAEILVGLDAGGATTDAPLDTDEDGWSYSYEPVISDESDLITHEVTVFHTKLNGTVDASYTLRRLARDPEAYVDAGLDMTGSDL